MSTFQVLPFGKGLNYVSSLPSAATYARWSVHSQLLLYLEQGNLSLVMEALKERGDDAFHVAVPPT